MPAWITKLLAMGPTPLVESPARDQTPNQIPTTTVRATRVGEAQELAGDAAGDELWLALRGELNRGQTVPRRVISSKGKKGQVREAEEKSEERESTTVTPTSITATWQRMIQQLAAPSRTEGAPGSLTSATPHTATSGVAGTAEIPETAPGGEWRRPPVAEDPPQQTHAKIVVAQAQSDRSQQAMATQYNKKVKHKFKLRKGLYVWIWYPAKGKGLSKLKHRWRGPARLVADVGFDNWKVVCAWNGQPRIVHSSACVPYFADDQVRAKMVEDIVVDATVDDDPWEASDEAVELRPMVGTLETPSGPDESRRSSRQREAGERQQQETGKAYQVDEMGIRRRRLARGRNGQMVPMVEVERAQGWTYISLKQWEWERTQASSEYVVPLRV
ncbi:hypothetical protein DYB31_010333 [Aphanomyces astaci]|uniref:Uncharacterized protein n=1 Tax=Aphanomyces astaci TaxID=112090 RepID=A0A397FP67_APHAT|nr:hypothetical protein DYB31_010333 [Aphanomyces astaci]